jgi:flagellar hook-associated protein 2
LNASVSVDGFLVSRSGNRIDDLVAGLSFELNEVGTARVNIAQDDVPIVQAMTGVVDKYNALKAKLDELAAGNLSGDGLTRSITSSVRSAMNRSFAGFGDFAVLTQLGISTTEDGELEFDTGRLTEALSANRTGVAEFFSSENGFGAALSTSLNAYLDNDGIFDTRVDGLNRRVSDLQNQQERWADRLIDIEERYRRQFTALDGLVAQLLNTSNFLAQQLDNLPGFTRNSDN